MAPTSEHVYDQNEDQEFYLSPVVKTLRTQLERMFDYLNTIAQSYTERDPNAVSARIPIHYGSLSMTMPVDDNHTLIIELYRTQCNARASWDDPESIARTFRNVTISLAVNNSQQVYSLRGRFRKEQWTPIAKSYVLLQNIDNKHNKMQSVDPEHLYQAHALAQAQPTSKFPRTWTVAKQAKGLRVDK